MLNSNCKNKFINKMECRNWTTTKLGLNINISILPDITILKNLISKLTVTGILCTLKVPIFAFR